MTPVLLFLLAAMAIFATAFTLIALSTTPTGLVVLGAIGLIVRRMIVKRQH